MHLFDNIRIIYYPNVNEKNGVTIMYLFRLNLKFLALIFCYLQTTFLIAVITVI